VFVAREEGGVQTRPYGGFRPPSSVYHTPPALLRRGTGRGSQPCPEPPGSVDHGVVLSGQPNFSNFRVGKYSHSL
jgi:hypothetical protein